MGNYRGVVRHVRYWRGAIHRWSTVYQFIGTLSSGLSATDAQALLTHDDAMCYGSLAAQGGTYECQLYDSASGGVPVAAYVAFDWTNPSAWLQHSHTGWTAPSGLMAEPAESALAVEWAGGLSKSGKPVVFRKWYHAVPQSGESAGVQDVPSASVTSLQVAAQAIVGVLGAKGLTMGSGTGRFAGTAHVDGYYGNHQMPRGRRRKALVKANGQYTGPSLSIPGGETITGGPQAVD